MPEFEGVAVFAFEISMTEAHRTAGRRIVQEVHSQLCDRLAHTPNHCLPRVYCRPGDFERAAREYYEDAYTESDEKFRVTSHCIHAQTWHCFGMMGRWITIARDGMTAQGLRPC